MDEGRDFIVLEDEDGNTLELDVVDYINYNGEEFALLTEPCDEECDCEDCDCDENEECDCEEGCGHQHNMYLMRVVVNEEDDTEEFIPIEDEALLQQLIELVTARYSEDYEDIDDEE